jgi:hypothetical protein
MKPKPYRLSPHAPFSTKTETVRFESDSRFERRTFFVSSTDLALPEVSPARRAGAPPCSQPPAATCQHCTLFWATVPGCPPASRGRTSSGQSSCPQCYRRCQDCPPGCHRKRHCKRTAQEGDSERSGKRLLGIIDMRLVIMAKFS